MAMNAQTITSGLCSPIDGLDIINNMISGEPAKIYKGMTESISLASNAVDTIQKMGDEALKNKYDTLNKALFLNNILSDITLCKDDIKNTAKCKLQQ